MRILIVGNGGRESALAMKLKDDSRITKMYFAKGTATTDKLGQNVYEETVEGLRNFAIKERIDLTIVGPEAPLVEGIVDEFKNTTSRFSVLEKEQQNWKEARLFLKNSCRPTISKRQKR